MSGVATQILLDSNGQDMAVRHVQDVEPILEHNALLRTMEQPSDWGRHIAKIPNVIYIQWLDEEHKRGNTSLRLFTPEFDEIVEKKLADPAWFHLRTDKPSLIVGWLGFGS
jgi:hypothetical protein